MRPLPPGSRLGRFEIVRVLGEGAMGVVYLGEDPHIERPVAIKTIRAEGDAARAAEIESRFRKEAKLTGRLQHPSIVTIYEFGRDGDVVFIAMEYVDGEPLGQWVAAHPGLSLADRVEIVRQVARALEHAHERGVVHRDVKPGNILVTKDGKAKVADFGIGKLVSGGSTDLTRTGTMIGSPAYMSPEQIRGDKIDGRSDFFSLGVVLYELLTGARPFPGDSITTLVYQILHTEPRDPLSLRSDLPPEAREVFARLLAKQPEIRPAHADEFIREIDRLVAELVKTQVTAIPPVLPVVLPGGGGPSAPAAQPSRTLTHTLFGLAAVLVAAAVLLAVWRAREKETGPVAVRAAVTSAALPVAATALPVPTALPTPGPAEAADMVVGAPRPASPATGEGRPTRPAQRPTAPRREAPREATVPATSPPESPPGPAPAGNGSHAQEPADRLYRTRRSARFGVSPDQARIYVDGRYVGIADDWDGHGGGRDLEFTNGTHRVRLELPGYQTIQIDMVVAPSADDDTVKLDDELKRLQKVSYPKIGPSLAGHTRGQAEFEVEPSDAELSEGDRKLGIAAEFGASSPLRLSGPRVHELVVSAPGYEPKTVRVLVSANSDNDRAKVKVKLKKT
ncbi:MAG TPA: protein kinase [Thermoanaerobaculia bacterium]|nr:protein kinase [Thermoanaerobaculia bacterium]